MSNKENIVENKGHMFVTLALLGHSFQWLFSFFGYELNSASFLGYPLAYYMTAQRSLLAFVMNHFWFANGQEKIDEEFGLEEKEDDNVQRWIYTKSSNLWSIHWRLFVFIIPYDRRASWCFG